MGVRLESRPGVPRSELIARLVTAGAQSVETAREERRAKRLRATTRLKLPACCVLAAALETDATLATFDATLARAAVEHGVTVRP